MDNAMPNLNRAYENINQRLNLASGLPPLLLRLYLAPIFMQAGYNKLAHFESTSAWFGNSDWGLGLPFPELLAALAGGTELIGGALLIPGIAVRLLSIPLAVTMLVAIFCVHWDHGWLALSDANSWLANERVMNAVAQKEQITALLKEHGNYGWLTQNGSVTILNNGIEFATTYFIMLLSLILTGAGRYTSVDHLVKYLVKKRSEHAG